MINLSDALISDQWPRPTADVEAYAYAVQQAISDLVEYADKSMCVAGIDNLDEKILDMLAVENRAVNYSQDYDIEKKRNIIKSVLSVYASSGTAAAVRQLINDIYSDSIVEEWYQYGGSPGHFRIIIYDTYDDEKVQTVTDIINKIGKYSAILDSINFQGGSSEAEIVALAGPIDYTITYHSITY